MYVCIYIYVYMYYLMPFPYNGQNFYHVPPFFFLSFLFFSFLSFFLFDTPFPSFLLSLSFSYKPVIPFSDYSIYLNCLLKSVRA